MRRLRPAAAALALAAGCLVLGPVSASADDAPIPGTMSTTAVNTTRFDVPVPDGVAPRAITGVLTMPEVVSDGVVTFSVNGRIARTVPSTLYAKVRIPVTAADVVADGTIGLTMATEGPEIDDLCRPAAGEATLRKIALDYRGKEQAPTTLANFFPPTSNRIDVVIAADADDDLLEAGVAAVAALNSRYPEGTEIRLGSPADAPTAGVATQRIVTLVAGRAGEVTTDIAVADESGIPVLTIAATGEDLAAAARALATTEGSDTLQLANDPDAEGISGELGSREPDLERSLADVGADEVVLSGYGVTSQTVTIPQDAFSTPVSAIAVHLQGAHSAVTDPDRARLDVRMNGELVGSTTLDSAGDLEMDFTVPAGRLRSVNELELELSALTPDGLPCAAPGSPPIEVDLDTEGSTLTATAGVADARGFRLWPQVLQGSLPVAVRSEGRQRFEATQDLARVVGALQRAASFPLDVQLVPADAFIADDRSGVIVGATTADATSLEAPLNLSSIRLLDQVDTSFEVTSQEPYAVLEAIGVDEREVLMLGGWSPGNQQAPRLLTAKLLGFLESTGWSELDGDLLLTDGSAPPFTVDSRTLEEETTPAAEDEGRSYTRWIFAGVGLLLLILAFQVVISIRRDRTVARSDEDDQVPGQPAYLEDLEDLEQNLPQHPPTQTATSKTATSKTTPTKTTPTKATTTRATTTRATTTRATTGTAAAKKTPAKKTPAKKAPVKKTTTPPKATPTPPRVTQRPRNQKRKRR